MSRRGEQAMVPEASFDSYYEQPVIKPPVWKTPDVPGYFFLGGLAGASSAMAALAGVTGRPQLVRAGRITAAAGAMGSVGALIHDLGRPERFLNMLRVIKPTSPLSVGSWTLAVYGPVAGAAAASEMTGWLPRVGRVAGVGAAVIGPVLSTYTAVLIADTAVPSWHEARQQLPFVFAGSSAASAGAVGMLAASTAQAGPARRMAVFGTALELGAGTIMERRLGMLGEPYSSGKSGRLMKAARALTTAGGVAAVAAEVTAARSPRWGRALGGSLGARSARRRPVHPVRCVRGRHGLFSRPQVHRATPASSTERPAPDQLKRRDEQQGRRGSPPAAPCAVGGSEPLRRWRPSPPPARGSGSVPRSPRHARGTDGSASRARRRSGS